MISAVLPVFNAGEYVKEAVESILNQSFRDFELLIFDDASTDNSLEILNGFKDKRIKIFPSKENKGYLVYLNDGLTMARGKYIARMDADDISHPLRFEKQFDFMENDPEIGVCGTWIKTFGKVDSLYQYPTAHEDIVAEPILGRSSLFGHPSVMMRKSLIDKYNIRYDANFYYAEDYELWMRLRKLTRFANLPEPLLFYRIHGDNVSVRRKEIQDGHKLFVRQKYFEEILERQLTEEELGFIKVRIGKYRFMGFSRFLLEVEAKNKAKALYDRHLLLKYLGKMWWTGYLASESPSLYAIFFFLVFKQKWFPVLRITDVLSVFKSKLYTHFSKLVKPSNTHR